MTKVKVFLDTSVLNFLFAEDAPEKQEVTIEYFNKYVRTQKYHHLISEFVVQELSQTPNLAHREKLLNVIEEYDIEVQDIQNEDEIRELAVNYIKAKIIPDTNKCIDI